jgi:alanyl-tRNA synthetase
MLGMERPFIFTLTSLVGELMARSYPELTKSREYAATLVKNEEERFSVTLSHGLGLLEELFRKVQEREAKVIPGEELFRLYDTYGFPFDLALEIAGERGLKVDEEGFQKELELQRQRARASWKGAETEVLPVYQDLSSKKLGTEFTGYSSTIDVKGRVLAILKEGSEVDLIGEGETGELVLDSTPFYSEAGGQVADQGMIENESFQGEVVGVQTPITGIRVHEFQVLHGQLRTGEEVLSTVDMDRRLQTANNHTATHLLQAALREALGEHIKQAGSLVAPDRLRFDFTHFKSLSSWEIQQIEERVNRKIRENIQVETEIKDLDQAIAEGATALFGEKYEQQIRVVRIPGYSLELCGGTHVQRTGEISLFKILSESSIAAGVRRVEAITGRDALNRFLEDESILADVTANLNVRREEVATAVGKLTKELKEANLNLEKLRLELARKDTGEVIDSVRQVDGVKVLSQKVPNLDRAALRQLADQIKNQLESGVVVLGTADDGKVSLVAMVTDDLTDWVKANELIQKIARMVGGGGGGKPDMAEAGGKNPAALDAALAKAYELVKESLESHKPGGS